MSIETLEQPASEPRPPQADANWRLKKYRCLIGHMICESLGYFTPQSALRAVEAHKTDSPFFCEWYSHQAMCLDKGAFDEEAVKAVNRSVIEWASRKRHDHRGYMAEYGRAKAIIDQEIESTGSTNSMLASWF